MRRGRWATATVLAGLLLAACHPGDIDETFGTNGSVTFDLGNQGNLTQSVVSPDGGIVVLGTWAATTAPSHISLHKLNANGTPDTTFGESGKVDTIIGYASGAWALARQPDDKLVVGGFSNATSTSSGTFTVVRYLPTGTLDASFGDDGVVVTNIHGGLHAVLIQPDNKIVVAGSGSRGVVVVRLNPDGTGDTSFGWAGVVAKDRFQSYGGPFLLRQGNGKLIVSGSGPRPDDTTTTVAVFWHLRLTPSGIGDGSFGDHGVVLTDFGFGPERTATLGGVALRAGMLLAAGVTEDASSRRVFALARYNDNGSLDMSFGTGGRVTRAAPSMSPNIYGFAKQPNDAVMLGGSEGSNALLARFTADGEFDSTYGSGGIATSSAIHVAWLLTPQPNGAVLVSSVLDRSLARFVG